MKKICEKLFHRVVLVALAMLLQLGLLLMMFIRFEQYYVYFYLVCTALSIGVVLRIVNDRSNPGYKIAWIIPILLVPVFGFLFYLLFGGKKLSRRRRDKMAAVTAQVRTLLPGRENPTLRALEQSDPVAANQSRYIERTSYMPVWAHTSSEFLPLGEVKFARMMQELEKAEHFIFLEYFIIEEGRMWNTIRDLLVRKAAQGVDVRLIYDDMGSIMTLPHHYERRLEAMGIQCCVFNPFVPVLSSSFNNRDHRKICVIDGHIGFTGGINLADEYINAVVKHGHWKDTAVILKGDGVWNLTVMFLSMWSFLRHTDEDFAKFRPRLYFPEPVESDGLVQPYGDSPLDDETVGESVYMNLINRANRYVYITTPYLIVDNEMLTALSLAAKQGVDVRIITPHIADKWYVHAVTRSYYEVLLENGVRIYEYTPGFIHSKTFVVDDTYATVGTVNLDYRSLYLHFECGVWLYRTRSVGQVLEDFKKTLCVCQEITVENNRVSWLRRMGRAVLRVFAPLM